MKKPLKPYLYGTYDCSGRFSYWFEDEDYQPRHSAIFCLAIRTPDESEEAWRNRAYAIVDAHQ